MPLVLQCQGCDVSITVVAASAGVVVGPTRRFCQVNFIFPLFGRGAGHDNVPQTETGLGDIDFGTDVGQ